MSPSIFSCSTSGPIASYVNEPDRPETASGWNRGCGQHRSPANLYDGLFAVLEDPASGFTTQTLPFDGGLELAIKTGLGSADPRRA